MTEKDDFDDLRQSLQSIEVEPGACFKCLKDFIYFDGVWRCATEGCIRSQHKFLWQMQDASRAALPWNYRDLRMLAPPMDNEEILSDLAEMLGSDFEMESEEKNDD